MAVSQSQLDAINALIALKFPQYSYVHPENVLVAATIPANSVPGVFTNAAMIINGTPQTQFNVPQSQVWVIKDLYITSTSADPTDAQVQIVKNGVKLLTITPPLSANVVTNPSRPGLSAPYLFEPNSSLTLPITPVSQAGTTTTTDTFFIDVIIYDASYS